MLLLMKGKHGITQHWVTWRAYEMEKPAVPGLSCVLPTAANSAPNNTMPLLRNSRFVASHLQEEESTNLLLGALFLSLNRICDYFAKHLWSCWGTGCSTKLLSHPGCSYRATLELMNGSTLSKLVGLWSPLGFSPRPAGWEQPVRSFLDELV